MGRDQVILENMKAGFYIMNSAQSAGVALTANVYSAGTTTITTQTADLASVFSSGVISAGEPIIFGSTSGGDLGVAAFASQSGAFLLLSSPGIHKKTLSSCIFCVPVSHALGDLTEDGATFATNTEKTKVRTGYGFNVKRAVINKEIMITLPLMNPTLENLNYLQEDGRTASGNTEKLIPTFEKGVDREMVLYLYGKAETNLYQRHIYCVVVDNVGDTSYNYNDAAIVPVTFEAVWHNEDSNRKIKVAGWVDKDDSAYTVTAAT